MLNKKERDGIEIKANKVIEKNKHVAVKPNLTENILMEVVCDNNLSLMKNYLHAVWDSGTSNKAFSVKELLLSIAKNGTGEMIELVLQWPVMQEKLKNYTFKYDMLTKACFNSVDGIGVVKSLLDLNFIQDILKQDIHAYHLCCAIQANSIDIVKVLLNQEGVLKNLDRFTNWILMDASRYGSTEILELLLSQSVLDSYMKQRLSTYLSESLYYGKFDAAQFLIAHYSCNVEELIKAIYNKPLAVENFLKLESGLNYVKRKSKTIVLDIINLFKNENSWPDVEACNKVIKLLLSIPEVKQEPYSLKKAYDLLSKCYCVPEEALNLLKEMTSNNLVDEINILEIDNPKDKKTIIKKNS